MVKMALEPSDDFLGEDSFFSEMMSSQSNLEDQVSALKVTVNGDRSMEEKIDELKNFFSTISIKNIPIDILDEQLFDSALGSARVQYFEVRRSIDELLRNKGSNNAQGIQSRLNTLLHLLKCWQLCVNQITTLEKISIANIKSFPGSFFEVTFDALRHCKASEKDCGDNSQSFSEQLTLLFRECVTTLNLFYALLDSVIVIDSNQESEMDILMKIVDETGKIASLANGMDAKTLTDMWKRFGKLSSIYHLELKNISPEKITCHFKELSKSISTVLTSVNQQNQRTPNERAVLCTRLLLKILEKLCEAYCGWIRNDVMVEIIVMLATLYRYTEQSLKIAEYNLDFIRFVESNLSFMIEPFLDVVWKNDGFKNAVFETENNLADDNYIGYHLLLLAILRKILKLPRENQRQWIFEEKSLLRLCFKNIDRLASDICMGKLLIQISPDVTQKSHLANIYEATCLSIFIVVCHTSNTDFTELTRILIQYLLDGKFFGSLLSSDVWCFVCRLGSSETCYRNFKYLVGVYEKLRERVTHPNVVMLANLLRRQYTFLNEQDKFDFVNDIKESSDAHRWKPIARIVDAQKTKLIQRQTGASDPNERLAESLKNLEEKPTKDNLSRLMNDLALVEASDVPQNEPTAGIFTKMWTKIVHMSADFEGPTPYLVEKLAISLIRATNPQRGQAKYITNILESMASLYPYASSHARLEFCRLLDRCSVHLAESDSGAVGELFCRLLGDPDSCVQQRAFESFELMTRACPDAGLLSSVALAIRNAQSEVSRTLPAYISGEVAHGLVGFATPGQFFETACRVVGRKQHACRERNLLDRQDKLFKLDDGQGGNGQDVEKLASRVCADMELIARVKGQLTGDTCSKLRQVCQAFLNGVDR